MSTLKLTSKWLIQLVNPAGEVCEERDVDNLRTTAGRDWIFGQLFSGSPVAKGLNYIALSTDATGGTAASTTLTSEITTNGLQRALGTYTYNSGQSICTLEHAFLCNTSAVTVQSAALFTDASVGTINHIVAFTAITVQVGWTLRVKITIVATGGTATINAGWSWIFGQVYSGSPLASQGLNYISLATGNLGPEIVGSGLDRALATYAHTAGTATCTLAHTFTYSGAGSAQLVMSALNTQAYPSGVIGLVITFTLAPQANGVPFTVTFTITVA
jgi:hypothetical protein